MNDTTTITLFYGNISFNHFIHWDFELLHQVPKSIILKL